MRVYKFNVNQFGKNYIFSISPNLKNVIYMAGIRYGDESDWELMWDQYLKETDATEKGKLLHALGQTRDSNLLARYAWCMYHTCITIMNTFLFFCSR